jgi:hypothetical protein
MKPLTILGALLILGGVAMLVLGQIEFTREETVLQLGDAAIQAETKDSVPLPPIAGIAAIVAGIGLVAVDRFRRR